MQIPMEVALVPRDELAAAVASGAHAGQEFGRMAGTPYGMRRAPLLSPFGIPCTAPPWGVLAAIDMREGKVLWKVPLGTTRDLAPLWLKLGVPNLGGPLVTASGLVFIGATTDNYLRAFSTADGRELWSGRLPAGGQASPMTYALPSTGKQYVVIAAGGHGKLGTKKGDSVVAYRLP
jgi:quinoprotein glucose dehydrogenase